MKKILFAIHTLGGGGAEKVLVNTANYLTDIKGYDVTVFTIVDIGRNKLNLSSNVKYKTTIKLNSNNQSKTKVSLLDDDFGILKKTAIFIYTTFWKIVPRKFIYSLFIKDKYDYEIAFLEGITAKFVSGSTNKLSKKIAWIHVDFENESKSKAFFRNNRDEENVYNHYDQIVGVSKVVIDSFNKQFPKLSSKTKVIYNPIDQQDILNKSAIKIESLNNNNNNNTIKFVSVGRLIEQKGYDRLIEAINMLVNNGYKSFHFTVLGTGPLYDEYLKLVEKYNLENFIEFIGFKDNPYAYIANANYFICSSRAEGYSTVVTEATIIGVPTITTNCSGMEEIFENDNLGFIVENSTNGLYEGILNLLVTPELYNDRKEFTEKCSYKFNLDNLVSKLEVDVLNEK